MSLLVRVDPSLRLFLRPRHRTGDVAVGLDGTSTLGHLVESLGVPLPEVGGLMLVERPGTQAVPVSYRPADGDVVAVTAVSRPQRAPTYPPRFVLDVHLGTLARRLRLLGLDALYRNDADDDELAGQAAREERVLLTQDRGLLRRRAVRHGAFVRGARPDEQLLDVLDRFRPPTAPFTRCPRCNGPLAAVTKADVAGRLEPGTRRSYEDFARCTDCGRVYWRGAHSRRLEQLVASAGAVGHDAPHRLRPARDLGQV